MPLGRRASLPAALLVTLACTGAPAPAASPGPAGGGLGDYAARIAPFPVSDSTGRLLELAFLGGLNQPRPQLVDLNGDGDLDLLVQEYTGRQMHFERQGTTAGGRPRFAFQTGRLGGLDIGEWSRFVDQDGDGDPDLFAELPYSYLKYFRNEGTRSDPRFAPATDTLRDTRGEPIFSDRQNIPQFVDLDCNGRLDLMIGRISGTILRYEQAAPGEAAPRFRLLTERFQDLEIVTGQGGLHGANTMAFVDGDGDGDLDLFWGDFFEAGLLFFENEGTCAQPVIRHDPIRFPPGRPLSTSGYNAPAFGDLDGDGRLDLVVGVLGGAYDPNRTSVANLLWYGRDSAGGWVPRTNQLLPMIDVGSESIPVLVDLDGDGDLDLLVANKIDPADRRTSRIYRFDNLGSPRGPVFRLAGALPLRGRYHFAPAFGDLDGDGRLDFLLGSFGAAVAWYRGAGDGEPPLPADSALVTIPRGSNTTPALGDLDGDGDLDLLIGEASGTLNFYRNDGTARAPRFVLVSERFEEIDVGRRSAPALVDLEGDGDLDLLIGSDDQGLVLYRNRGTRTAPRFVRDAGVPLDLPPLTAPSAGDLDGDGIPEFLIGTAGGGLIYLERARTR